MDGGNAKYIAVVLSVGLLAVCAWAARSFLGRATVNDDAPVRPAGSSAASAASGLDPSRLTISSVKDDDERVRRVFPKGVASEDARSEIGTAPPPPDHERPDASGSFVAEIAPRTPVSAAVVRAALGGHDAGRIGTWVKGQVASSGRWLHVQDEAANDAVFSRLAVTVDLVDDEVPVEAQHLERELQWVRRIATQLEAGAPVLSMSLNDATNKAHAALAARKKYSEEDLDVGVVVAASPGGRFAGRKVWDAVYSAGFTWGDGDYFHWIPSAQTDVSQGISMGTSTGTSYFLPESVAADDGSADVADLEMSFNAARCWEPTKVFDVMSRAAAYLARRLGGTVRSKNGDPFDVQRERARVVEIENGLKSHGLTPGAELTLQLF